MHYPAISIYVCYLHGFRNQLRTFLFSNSALYIPCVFGALEIYCRYAGANLRFNYLLTNYHDVPLCGSNETIIKCRFHVVH